MTGRDFNEKRRAAKPIELLFDLTFAVAFGPAFVHRQLDAVWCQQLRAQVAATPELGVVRNERSVYARMFLPERTQ